MDFSYSLTTTVWVLDEANLFIKKLKVVTRNASFQDYNYLFLSFSENGSKKALEGQANYALKTGDEAEEMEADIMPLNRISTNDLAATVERLAANPNLQNLASRDVSTREAIKSLRSLFNDQRFQVSYQFAQKVSIFMYYQY